MLKKLFGTDPHKLVTRADAQLEQGDFGGAKLTYERALGGLDEADRTSVQSKINTCRNGIARTRLDEAKRLAAQGALDLAHDEIAGALEVAVDPAIEAEAQALVDGFERDEAVAQAQVTTMSDEEQLALIMGQWEAEQADEYDGYGRTFDEAILAMHQERAGDALRALEVITQEACGTGLPVAGGWPGPTVERRPRRRRGRVAYVFERPTRQARRRGALECAHWSWRDWRASAMTSKGRWPSLSTRFRACPMTSARTLPWACFCARTNTQPRRSTF